MIVADDKQSLQITGNGDVLEPHDGIIGEHVSFPSCSDALWMQCSSQLALMHSGLSCAAIGSGGAFALAAARALIEVDGLDAATIGKFAL